MQYRRNPTFKETCNVKISNVKDLSLAVYPLKSERSEEFTAGKIGCPLTLCPLLFTEETFAKVSE